jgi:hypothetical protein
MSEGSKWNKISLDVLVVKMKVSACPFVVHMKVSVLNIKCVLTFSTTFIRDIYHSQE